MIHRNLNWVPVSLAILCALVFCGCERKPVEVGKAEYSNRPNSPQCTAAALPGKAGVSDDEETANGIRFNVRAPSNYNPALQHPLIVVYAPAGRSRFSNERMSGLTLAATSAGFVIAYADHQRMSAKTLVELAGIPAIVSAKWCIDPQRIYLSGHSDGGTTAMGLGFLEDTRGIPDAIATSAAGIRASDLARYPCPEPLPVLVMHSKKDELFPGFGQEAAQWWANCNRCAKDPLPNQATGCLEYSNCSANVKTWYCEGENPHGEWPPELNSTILKFFEQPRAASQPG